MSMHIQTIKQKLWLQIEALPETRLQEVLDFVEFLLSKDKPAKKQETSKLYTQQEILIALGEIRETIQQTYGTYQGDLIAEARAERDEQMRLNLGLGAQNENRH